jgi:hypothetical protein
VAAPDERNDVLVRVFLQDRDRSMSRRGGFGAMSDSIHHREEDGLMKGWIRCKSPDTAWPASGRAATAHSINCPF